MQNNDDQSMIECSQSFQAYMGSQAYKMEQQYICSSSDDEHEDTYSEPDSESQVIQTCTDAH